MKIVDTDGFVEFLADKETEYKVLGVHILGLV